MGMDGNPGALLAILGLAVLFLVALLPRLLRRGAASRLKPGTFGEPGMNVKAELERLVVEIREVAREELARLDARMRQLGPLLEECDRKAKELEALLERAAAASGGGAGGEPPLPARPSNPLHDQVYALRDSGKEIHEIGAATGLEKGEIELILGLRQVPPMKPPAGE